jgi:hypothetical protein
MQSNQQNQKQVAQFKEGLFGIFAHDVDIKSCWQSQIQLIKLLIDTNTDLTNFILHKKALNLITCAFVCIFNMHQEATACNVQQNLLDVMSICHAFFEKCKLLLLNADTAAGMSSDHQHHHHPAQNIKFIINQQWKEKYELCKRLLLLLNFHNSLTIRDKAIDLLNLFLDIVNTSDTLLNIIHLLYVYYSHSNQFQLSPCLLYNGKNVKNNANVRMLVSCTTRI